MLAGGAASVPAASPPVSAPFAYDFNRNALTAAVRAPGGDLLSATDTGNLLLFDSETFALKAERVARAPVSCLGPAGPGGVLVGLEDGRVVEVAIPSLKMTLVAQVDGQPAWIGRAPSGRLLVAYGLTPEKPFGFRARGISSLALDEIDTGRTMLLPFIGEAFLLDRQNRLWLGADNGEWGGRLAVVDLARWTVRAIADDDKDLQGVYGFTETPAGHILAYGGTAHMGGCGNFIMAVDRQPAAKLFETPFARPPSRQGPSDPVTHIVPLRGGRSYLVLAYGQLFEADPTFTTWKQLPRFEAKYEWGRPTAVGAFPAAKSIHLLGESPLRLAISTALDGWIELRWHTYARHSLAGQIGSSEISAFDDWAGRVVARSDEESWVLGPQGWAPIDVSSPVGLPFTRDQKRTPGSTFLPRSDGKLLAVFRDEPEGWDSGRPALVVTALCSDGHCETLAQEQSLVNPAAMFLTPDDSAWTLDELGLWSFRDAHWVLVLPRGRSGHRSLIPETSRVLGVARTEHPPWILSTRGDLLLLWPGSASGSPRVVRAVHLSKEEYDRRAEAVSCGGHLYVARDGGICMLDTATGACAATRVEAGPIERLGCDRQGRLWLGGKGLWTLQGKAATPSHDLDAVLGGSEIRALGRDTGAGMPVAMEDRGVAVIGAGKVAPAGPVRESDEGDRLLPPGRPRQAVFVLLDGRGGRDCVGRLEQALVDAKAGRFGGYASRRDGTAPPVFYGQDAAKMVEILRATLDLLGKRAVLIRRDGEPGTHAQRIQVMRPGGQGEN